MARAHASALWQRLPILIRAILVGTAVALAGTTPWAWLVSLNTKHLPWLPWAVVPSALYLWLFWRYLGGAWWPRSTAPARRTLLRARHIPEEAFGFGILAGFLGLAALEAFSMVLSRLVTLPPQSTEGLEKLPGFSVVVWVLMGALVAGVVEESSFRGYMQGPIERRHGPVSALLVTGVLFGFAHFGHREVGFALLPFYMFAATVYGALAYTTNSILPGIVLHTFADIFGGLQLLGAGQSEWLRPVVPKPSVWHGGADASFWFSLVLTIVLSTFSFWTFRSVALLARSAHASDTLQRG